MSVSISLLDDIAVQLQNQGKELDSLKFLERSLLMRQDFFGGGPEVEKIAEQYVVRCNLLAMRYLKEEDFVLSFEFLKKAEWCLGERANFLAERPLLKLKLLAATWNNYGCYFKRRSKLSMALQYLEKAVKAEEALYDKHHQLKGQANELNSIEKPSRTVSAISDRSFNTNYSANEQVGVLVNTEDNILQKMQSTVQDAVAISLDTSATTHLNICAVLSQLGKHRRALSHAKSALRCLEVEERNQKEFYKENDVGYKKWLEKRDQSVKAVVYHNLAVELEFLNDYRESKHYYRKSFLEAKKSLGLSHPTTQAIRTTYINAFGEPPPMTNVLPKDNFFRRNNLLPQSVSGTSSKIRKRNSMQDFSDSSPNFDSPRSDSFSQKYFGRVTSTSRSDGNNSIKKTGKRRNSSFLPAISEKANASQKKRKPAKKASVNGSSHRRPSLPPAPSQVPQRPPSIRLETESFSSASKLTIVPSPSTSSPSSKLTELEFDKLAPLAPQDTASGNSKISLVKVSSSPTKPKQRRGSDASRKRANSKSTHLVAPSVKSPTLELRKKRSISNSPYIEEQHILDVNIHEMTPIRRYQSKRSKMLPTVSTEKNHAKRRYSSQVSNIDPDEAATIIQRNIRGWICRKQYRQRKAIMKSYEFVKDSIRVVESPSLIRMRYSTRDEETNSSTSERITLADDIDDISSGRFTPRDTTPSDFNGRPLSRQSSRNTFPPSPKTMHSTPTPIPNPLLAEAEYLFSNDFEDDSVASPAVFNHLKSISATLESLQRSLVEESQFVNESENLEYTNQDHQTTIHNNSLNSSPNNNINHSHNSSIHTISPTTNHPKKLLPVYNFEPIEEMEGDVKARKQERNVAEESNPNATPFEADITIDIPIEEILNNTIETLNTSNDSKIDESIELSDEDYIEMQKARDEK